MVERSLTAMIRALYDVGVEFVVVGELSAMLNGYPMDVWC
jgi:hypothetical protein